MSCVCTCTICGPGGKAVDYKEKRRHAYNMRNVVGTTLSQSCLWLIISVQSTHPTIDDLERDVFKMTFQEDSSQVPSHTNNSPSHHHSRSSSQQTSAKESEEQNTRSPSVPPAMQVREQDEQGRGLPVPPQHVLEGLMGLEQVLHMDAMRHRSDVVFDTGTHQFCWLLEYLRADCSPVEQIFDHPLTLVNPLVVIAMFLALILNVFGGLSQRWSKVSLSVLKVMIQTAWSTSQRKPTAREEHLLKFFPEDIRTVRKAFDMEAKTTTYATCPKCFALYEPDVQGELLVYPPRCDYKPTPRSQPCRARLTTQHVKDGESIRVPIKPFVIQDLDAFVGNLLSRPGIEDALESRKHWQEVDELRDVQDGASIRTLKGPDGRPFMCETNDGELRLAWSLCVDWFNPYHNKAAGKSASVGSIVMACLNLPPELRYKPENLFLVGLIPGPREPSREQINHILRPIISKLIVSWSQGTWFTRTPKYARGRLVRNAISESVNDLQASKKVNGCAAWPAKYFCSFCMIQKSDMNNIDWTSWELRNHRTHLDHSREWQNATSKTMRNRIFSDHGVRWSEMMRLPYWDPTRHVVVDGMHNLFLGLVQFHCRVVLGISTPVANPKADDSYHDIEHARPLLSSNPTANKLRRLKVSVLRAWCNETGIRMSGKNKKDLISAILSNKSGSNDRQPALPSPQEDLGMEEIDLPDEDGVPDKHGAPGEDEGLPHNTSSEISQREYMGAHLSKNEISHLRNHIAETTRPSWHVAPPSNLGESKHGKLKADQWRSSIEFDIPVSLAQMWSGSDERTSGLTHEVILRSTLLLATAIRWATSHKTSKMHAANYTRNMHAYLQTLLDMFPNRRLRPNHHAALHIGPQLLLFGPMHGWWTFPFERIVGLLQNYNTNDKLGKRWCRTLSDLELTSLAGQMERTMLETFCAASNIKAFVRRPSCPPVLKTLAPLLETCWSGEKRGTLMEDIRSLKLEDISVIKARDDINWKRIQPIEDDVRQALASISTQLRKRIPDWITPTRAFPHSHHTTRGATYSTAHASKRDSTVFFKDMQSDTFVPGIIRGIFSVEWPTKEEDQFEELFFMIIHKFLPLGGNLVDPFREYPDFGANLWLKELNGRPTVIPSWRPLCHAIFRPWDEDTVVMKPLDRVSETL